MCCSLIFVSKEHSASRTVQTIFQFPYVILVFLAFQALPFPTGERIVVSSFHTKWNLDHWNCE